MSITKKLLLINTLICMAFILIIIVVFFSFRHVEKVLTTTFASETRRIIKNSNMARGLSRVLSDMNFIIGTFYENNEVLKTGGKRLVSETETLLAKSGDEELKASLSRFREEINSILAQCAKVNHVRQNITQAEKKFENQLISLDNIVAETLVELITEGEDTLDMEQLSMLIGGWREFFMRINLRFVQLGLEHFKRPIKEDEHPLLTLLDDLQLRLRTLTAAKPSIAEHGRHLISLVLNYKKLVSEFYQVAGELRISLEKINYEKENLLLMMEKTDKLVEKKTGEATASLTAQIENSLMINLLIFLGILPIVILGGLTAYSIKKPVQKIIEYIERISKGDIPKQINEKYRGEFALVRDYLNMLINASESVTQIAEKIASGDMEIVVRERSENDRLMQALNSMIHSLKQFQKETDIMIQSVGTGRLDIRGNAESFKGGWRELVTGVNHLIAELSSAVSEKAVLGMEMELAKKIQTSLLPTLADSIHPDFTTAATMIPADEVGGDFYDISFDGSGNLWFAIGDVSGHGVTPGLIMMMAQTIHATVTTDLDCSARDAVIKINKVLYNNVHERLKEKHFMTFNALKYLGKGKFEHAGAHLRIIVYRQKSNECELIRTKGVYLNLKEDISRAIKNSYFELRDGDVMVLYTDGLTEAENLQGEILDISGFVSIVEKYAHHPPEVMKESITSDVLNWSENIRNDDMTLVIIKKKESYAKIQD